VSNRYKLSTGLRDDIEASFFTATRFGRSGKAKSFVRGKAKASSPGVKGTVRRVLERKKVRLSQSVRVAETA
jgi:hypothetical protein